MVPIFELTTPNTSQQYSVNYVFHEVRTRNRLMRGTFSNANDVDLFLMIFPRMSLHCKLVPVQYRGYEERLLASCRSLRTQFPSFLLETPGTMTSSPHLILAPKRKRLAYLDSRFSMDA